MTTDKQRIAKEEAQIQEAVFNHDKHYRALIGWMKRKKKTAHDLCDLFAEGSTVAHRIWNLYDTDEWPRHSEKYHAAHSEQGWVSVTLDSLPPVDEQITLVCMRDTFPKAETMSLNHENLYFIAQGIRTNAPDTWTHWKSVEPFPAPPVHPESAQQK